MVFSVLESIWLWGGRTSSNQETDSNVFNDSTRFFNICFITLVMALYSLALLVPCIYRIKDLISHERGRHTYFGQVSTLFALFCPGLWISHALVINVKLAPYELISISIGFVASLLHHIQDGRVSVCSPELTIYWIGQSMGYVSYAIDSTLRFGWSQSLFIVVAALLSIINLTLELKNPQRYRNGSYENFSTYDKATISFGNRTMEIAQSNNLLPSDFPSPPVGIKSYVSNRELQSYFDSYSPDSKYRILLALKDLVGLDVLISAVLFTFMILLELSVPQFMILFLRSLSDYKSGKKPLYRSYYLAVLVSIPQIAMAIIASFQGLRTEYCRSKSRAALTAMVYRKSLSLDPKSRATFSESKLVNFVSLDVNQIVSLVERIPLLLIMPSIIPYALWQLWSLLGPSFLVAALVYLLLFPCQTSISKRIGKVFPILSSIKDDRNKLITNVITCIKSLKLYSWELAYFEKICQIRENELKVLTKVSKFDAVLNSIYESTSSLISGVIFSTYLWMKCGTLTPEVVFPAIFLLENISINLMLIPRVVFGIQKSLTSQSRLNEMLSLPPHIVRNYEQYSTAESEVSKKALVINKAKLSWDGDLDSSKIALEYISLEADKGDLICIVGRVGSGKTAILHAIANDLCILEGNITVRGSLAICTQSIWLENTTIRDNILFGEFYNEEWYQKVLKSCVLDDDLITFTNGDLTNIGERGITLSGGQKARVALARAVYSRADIYLLDDVLSAVDELVSATLINNLFSCRGILANRTVILVTNNINVLSHSSRIVALSDKRITESLCFENILQKREESTIFKLIQEFGDLNDLERNISSLENRKQSVVAHEVNNSSYYPPSIVAEPPEFNVFDVYDVERDREENDGNTASLKVFVRYSFLGKRWLAWAALLVTIIAMVLNNFIMVFLGKVTSQAFDSLSKARNYLLLYFVLVLLNSIVTVTVTGVTDIGIGLRNAKVLHEQMLWSVLRAPMAFFDKTSIGKIINRFTSDISEIDDGFADMFASAIRSFISLLINLLGIIIGSPLVLVIVGPMAWFANNVRNFYVPSRRKVTRHFEAANSPILSQVENTLSGRLTIKSFGRTSRYIDIFEKRVDCRIKTSFFLNLMRYWLDIRISALSTILSMAAALGVSQLIGLGKINTSYAGVVLKFSESCYTIVCSLVENIANVETSGISLERIFEFIDLASEEPHAIETTKPSAEWPTRGELTFNNFSARYSSDSPLILKNLQFKIKGGEKIAIVGRTGSGKSTLALSLFRVLEAAEGSIELDNVNISILSLSFLRSHISVVPQDVHIFDSTLRDNLDPTRGYDDTQLWEALEECQLKELINSLGGLDIQLKGNEISLSHGQCQLLCLCRVLLRKSKVLVLDEATASVDFETDKLIQKTIRSAMRDLTVITVAHRLNTVMDADRIMVLEGGEVKEFDTPHRLLEQKGSFFSLFNARLEKIKD